MNTIKSLILNTEERSASGTNLYNMIVEGRSLEAVLCRENGIAKKDCLDFQVKFEDNSKLPFTATFLPTDDGWVEMIDILPCSEQGNMFI